MDSPAHRSSFPVMVVAGEPSGDALAAELIGELRGAWPSGPPPEFFGAGGANMSAAGAELLADLASHAVIGLIEALKHYRRLRPVFSKLVAECLKRDPVAVVLVDFSGFNRRLAAAIRAAFAPRARRPIIAYYVSPQVWASRPKRAKTLERDLDILLSIFPFEKKWYAEHAPRLRVEFVGHPIVSRHSGFTERIASRPAKTGIPSVALLPGSRRSEIARHLPVMLEAASEVQRRLPSRWTLVAPDDSILELAKKYSGNSTLPIRRQAGGLAETLAAADLAIASTGTVTMECAFFRVPTVALYKTSWSTYQIAKRIIQVRFLAMPNLLANEVVFPEFVQGDATARNLAGAALALLQNPARRAEIRGKLDALVASLGPPGACARAATHLVELIRPGLELQPTGNGA